MDMKRKKWKTKTLCHAYQLIYAHATIMDSDSQAIDTLPSLEISTMVSSSNLAPLDHPEGTVLSPLRL
ncbi:hypothetical protein EYC84_005943 [Monilinia fructicola]|uniref:Uncharacterized protein n=1 Tax=Monilinia fructicola TaxID=38448 RepID=A0A5M9JY48_MONFR|nr:hypothetical protein EYC84_005943 [Monilinia fructicola]